MTDRPWKQHERDAGALIGGRRYPANLGLAVDCESSNYVAQCKNVRVLSLAALEALALEAERQGAQRTPPKVGMVIVKRRGGKGTKTPLMVVMTAAAFREMSGPLPTET